MEHRKEAVEYLCHRGIFAEERDWALGETVVAAGGTVTESGGIRVYSRVLYIVREDDGWAIIELLGQREVRVAYGRLLEACERAVARLSPLPVGVWGEVIDGPDDEILALRIEPSTDDSFYVLLRTPRGEFDDWVQSTRHLEEYLADFVVEWPTP